jgi:hypothetical protein
MANTIPAGRIQLPEQAPKQFAAMYRLEASIELDAGLGVNGQPGQLLIAPDGSVWSVLTIDVADDAIQAVRIIRNPDKLAHVGADAALLAGRRRRRPRGTRTPGTRASAQAS